MAVVLLACSAAQITSARSILLAGVALVGVMLLNLLLALAGGRIALPVGYPASRIVGWSFAAALAALAVQDIARPLQLMLIDLKAGSDDDVAADCDREHASLRAGPAGSLLLRLGHRRPPAAQIRRSATGEAQDR